MPPMKLRLANIELPKNDQWVKRQREKGIFKRMFDVLNEPRFKFYVKEGRWYTTKSGVPGVWEEVAARIHGQTFAKSGEKGRVINGVNTPVVARRPISASRPAIRATIKRQTSRAQ